MLLLLLQVLVENGASEYRIVLKDPTAEERYAAEELARFVREMTGAELDGRREIRFVRGRKGYEIRGDLEIHADHPLPAVYAILEEAGCRWFTPSVARIPKVKRLEVRPHAYVPPFEYREDFYTEAFDGDWAARLRSNGHHARLEARHGGKISYHPFVHTFEHILPAATHFRRHPEWYAEVDGRRVGDQLCLTNAEVLRLTIECVRGWIRDHPEAAIFSVSQNDNQNYCRCDECRKMEPSAAILRFVNAVAEQFPDKLIDTLAYQYSRRPPKDARPRANVRVRLCTIECCFVHPLADCDHNRSFRDDIVAWSKVTDRLYVWDYVTDFAHYHLPFPNLKVLQPNLKFFRDHGVRGVFEEGNYSTGGGGEFSELRAYMLGRLLWNPDADPEMKPFCEAVYGEDAPHVLEYLELLHRPRADHLGIYVGPEVHGREFVGKAAAIFAKTKGRAARKASIPVLYLQQDWKRFLAACDEFGVTHVNEWQTLADFRKGKE